jgi:hypothetical protein
MKQRLWQSQSAGRRSTHRAQASRRHGHDKGQREALVFLPVLFVLPYYSLAGRDLQRAVAGWRACRGGELEAGRGSKSKARARARAAARRRRSGGFGGDGCAGCGQGAGGGRTALYSGMGLSCRGADEARPHSKPKPKGRPKSIPATLHSLGPLRVLVGGPGRYARYGDMI